MSFRAKKFRFLADFSLVFGVSVKGFLHTVSQPLEKHWARKPHQNRKEFFLRFVVKFFNSAMSKDCFCQLKRNCSVFMHDLERVNEFYA